MSSSWESSAAERMATTYGGEVCRLDRAGRIAWARGEIGKLEQEDADKREAHERDCERCQRGAFCMSRFTLPPHYDEVMKFKGIVEMENRDQEYADRARIHRPAKKDHVDGFCAYWQNVIHRRFVFAGWKCEGCGERRKLEGHHCTEGDFYEHLGFEEIDDLQALCRDCHEKAPR